MSDAAVTDGGGGGFLACLCCCSSSAIVLLPTHCVISKSTNRKRSRSNSLVHPTILDVSENVHVLLNKVHLQTKKIRERLQLVNFVFLNNCHAKANVVHRLLAIESKVLELLYKTKECSLTSVTLLLRIPLRHPSTLGPSCYSQNL